MAGRLSEASASHGSLGTIVLIPLNGGASFRDADEYTVEVES